MDITINPGDERLIRNELERFVCTALEARSYDLSDGLVKQTMTTDALIRLVQGVARDAIKADRAQRDDETVATAPLAVGDLVSVSLPGGGTLLGVVGFSSASGLTVFGHDMSVQSTNMPARLMHRAGSQEARTFARRLIERGAFLPAIVREALLAQIGD